MTPKDEVTEPNPEPASEGRCGKDFETICNRPKGHKGMCGWEPEPSSPSVAQEEDFPPTWERIGALHRRIGQLEELLKVHVKKIRNQKTEIKRLQMLHESASVEIERLKTAALAPTQPDEEELARRIAELEFLLRLAWTFVPPGGSLSSYIEKALSANPEQRVSRD